MAGFSYLGPKSKNMVVAGGLTAFVFGVYIYTTRAVGGTDELQVAIDKFEDHKQVDTDTKVPSKMFRAGSVGTKSTSEYIDWDEYDNEIVVCGDNEWDEKGRTKISRMYIAFDEVIRSIQFGYLENGSLVLSEKYGSSEGYNVRVVRLNQDEYVTGLSGVLGMRGGIRNLTFHTNRGKHGPIGRSSDDHPSAYEIDIDPAISDPREFGGFFGSCSLYYLSSIGVYVNPNGMFDSEVKP